MDAQGNAVSKPKIWTGRILTGLAVLFLLFDSITKILLVDAVVKASAGMGFSLETVQQVGVILLVCVVVYIIPQTSILGAVLLTGYLGGAVVTNLRAGTPLFTNVLFPVYFGIIVWGGIFLRDARLRALFPIRTAERSA